MPRSAALVVAVVAVTGTGCGTEADEPAPEQIPRRAVGVIVDLDVEGTSIQGFVLRAGDNIYEVRIDPDIDYGFDLEHLREHQQLEEPVDVALEQREDGIYATEILDA